MFLARVTHNFDISGGVRRGVLHIANNREHTLCCRYRPIELVYGKDLKFMLGEYTLKEFLNLVYFNSINASICKFCIEFYMSEY